MILPRRVYVNPRCSFLRRFRKKTDPSFTTLEPESFPPKRKTLLATNFSASKSYFLWGAPNQNTKKQRKKPMVLGLHHPSFSMLLAIPTSKAILDSSPFFLQTGLQVEGVAVVVKHQDHQVGHQKPGISGVMVMGSPYKLAENPWANGVLSPLLLGVSPFTTRSTSRGPPGP